MSYNNWYKGIAKTHILLSNTGITSIVYHSIQEKKNITEDWADFVKIFHSVIKFTIKKNGFGALEAY